MGEWLSRVEDQISNIVKDNIKDDFPPLVKLFKWADSLVDEADTLYHDDVDSGKFPGIEFALKAQEALVVSLVIGRFFPPLRLYIVRTIVHPSMSGRLVGVNINATVCTDKDCSDPKCIGNHFQVFRKVGEQEERVRLVAPHHKNDRKGFRAIKFTLPLGPITTLILRFAKYGHKVRVAACR